MGASGITRWWRPCGELALLLLSVAVLTVIFGRRVFEMKHAPSALISLRELVQRDEGEALIVAAAAMSRMDVERAINQIEAVEFAGDDTALNECNLSKSSSSCVWDGISAATHMAARRECEAGDALKSSLMRAFFTMRSQPDYHPFDDKSPSSFWSWSSYPLENYLWALIQIEGIDGHRWLEHAVVSHAADESEWIEDVTSFTSILAWAAYEDKLDTATWKWAVPNGFDERWPLRFAKAARDHGYDMQIDDLEELESDLRKVIERYGKRSVHKKGARFEEFWLAASSSMLLAELPPRRSLRRIFPLGAGQDGELIEGLLAVGEKYSSD